MNRRALAALALVVGLGIGELVSEYIDAVHESRRVYLYSDDPGTEPEYGPEQLHARVPRSRRGPDNSAESGPQPSPGTPPQEDTAVASVHDRFPWFPSAVGSQLRDGEAGAPLLHRWDWWPAVYRLPAALASTERVQRARTIIEASLRLRDAKTPPPWDEDRFQVAGACGPSLSVIGRDFEIAASPEQTLAWWLKRTEARPDPSEMDAALRGLRRYELERRALKNQIHGRLLELARSGIYEREDYVGFHVTSASAHLVPVQTAPTLRDLRDSDERVFSDLQSRVEEYLQ